MQLLSSLNKISISWPSSYITSNVRNCNLCYQFHLILTYDLSTHINNIRKITLGLKKVNSPRFGYAIGELSFD